AAFSAACTHSLACRGAPLDRGSLNEQNRRAKDQGGPMAEFSRDEVYAAWKRRMELQDGDDWDGFGRTFTEDAVYHEHHYGVVRGRHAILEWLVPVMQYCKGWTYPVVW